MMNLRVLIAAVTAGISQLAVGQTVAVEFSGDDSLGRQLAYEVREAVRRSSSMKLATAASSGGYGIRLVSMNPEAEAGLSNRTFYSYVITMRFRDDEYYVYNTMGYCGASRIAGCASGIVARVDEIAMAHRKEIEDAMNKSQPRR